MAKRIKIVTIVGARPQFIKAVSVSNALKKIKNSFIEEVLVHTGQHYDYKMSGVFFRDLDLPKPQYFLEIGSHSHGKQTGLMLEKIERVLLKEKPYLVMVYGDTNSTLAGALAASKLHIPIAHVEAGMRSFNKTMPEEINRVLVDHLSTLLFCSSKTAMQNLEKEGIYDHPLKPFRRVFNVGDVMVDSLKEYSRKAKIRSNILKTLNLKSKSYFLATIHRAENTDNKKKLEVIFRSLNEISKKGHHIIMPLHPRTRSAFNTFPNKKLHPFFHLTDPVSYLDMLCLEKNALGVFTDSGGVQKEAYLFKIPALTLRDETEWVETIQEGWNKLVPIEIKSIKKAFYNLKKFRNRRNLIHYGQGTASIRIISFIQNFLSSREGSRM